MQSARFEGHRRTSYTQICRVDEILYICVFSLLSLNPMLLGFLHTGGKSLTLNAGGTQDPVTAEKSEERSCCCCCRRLSHPEEASLKKQ